MRKRRGNKSVKQMMVDVVDVSDLSCESWVVWGNPYWINGELCVWMNGNCFLDSKVERIRQGTISLTASELKGE